MSEPQYLIDFEPIGRRVHVPAGTDILTAAQLAGVDLLAVCGGVGICGSCLLRLVQGELTQLTSAERDQLDEDQIAKGYRLACQASPRSDVRLEVPVESLPAGQKLQLEGHETAQNLNPAVSSADLAVAPPDLHDLRSDFTRVKETLALQTGLETDAASLAQLSDLLRQHDWQVRLGVGDAGSYRYLAGTCAPDDALLGLAVDMGSTKLAFYLVNLETGATLAQTGVMNPQISYGEDVVSRIAFANRAEENRRTLQARLVDTINQTAAELCAQAKAEPEQIVDAVMVGNTAMHHFFCALPVSQLGAAPYVPAVGDPLLLRAESLGLDFAPGARVYLPANIAGYVGGDHTAALLSSNAYHKDHPVVLVDIGTNTEISLLHGGRIITCSTASGPAFEGAHIRDGMRAAPGAIDSLRIQDDYVQVSTIGDASPVGICGSGILSAVSEMLREGLLDERGMLNRQDQRIRVEGRKTVFPLVSAERSGSRREIAVSRKDVNEIQMAKGAIRSGIDILLKEAGLGAGDVGLWIIAGAFGTYLDLESAVRIGMFPAAPLDRFRQVGNAAGMGAKQMLLDRCSRKLATGIIEQVDYVELTAYKAFTEIFLKNMYLYESK